LVATSFDVVTPGGGLGGLPGWLRAHYVAALDEALPAPHAAVLLGIVLGVRQGIPSDLQNALIATGLIHLLVLSGLKVAVFARILQGALKPILGRHATWPAIALIGLYALVGGATPAAVRAAIMGGLAITASRLGRPSHVWTSLAVTAAAMLAWHPELAWDVGFQLSFAGTAAIILLTPAIERRLPHMPAVLREPFAVTCAAQVGTLPMMATDFHVLSPIAPIANALTLPILPALVVDRTPYLSPGPGRARHRTNRRSTGRGPACIHRAGVVLAGADTGGCDHHSAVSHLGRPRLLLRARSRNLRRPQWRPPAAGRARVSGRRTNPHRSRRFWRLG